MNRKIVLSSLAAIALVGAAAATTFLSSSHGGNAEAADPRSLPALVRIIKAKPPNATSRSFTGTVAARVQSDLGFRVPGKIIERLVNPGDEVRAGQPLMRIDDTDLRLALSAKNNAVAAARATFVQAQADERRYAALVANGVAASPQRYEQAKAMLDTATAQLAAAQAEASVAQNAADYATLIADADGTIVETSGEPGQVVSAGQPVVRLAKFGPREALVWIPETFRPLVGTTARAIIYGRSNPETAVLRQISDAAEPQTRTFETRWVLQDAAASTPLGATVTIRLADEDKQVHAEIPVGALVDDGTRTGLWVLDQETSKVHFRDVKIERLGEEQAVVTNISVGETIVALGAHLLQEGSSVRTGATGLKEASR